MGVVKVFPWRESSLVTQDLEGIVYNAGHARRA
ncbi:hypothetical protein TNMX_07485 [Thermus sp. NMX2.A1]|nr:hypothetical protein TNMX_07485 [Thermus sp. NMX2.A1]